MDEIFVDIPDEVKNRAKFVFDMAIHQTDLMKAVQVLQNYTQTCTDEDERKFVEFYFRTRMEQLNG